MSYNYCKRNAIIPQQQFRFLRHFICEMALLLATDSWLAAPDKGSYVYTLLIDPKLLLGNNGIAFTIVVKLSCC